MSTAANATSTTVGWVSSPSGRGTIDVIWACGFTILLCTWTVLCVNVAPPNASSWYLAQRKAWLACMCWAGPEFLLYLAVGQWQSASRSAKEFQDMGYSKWSVKHGFFADMGGFALKTADGTQFPLDSRQLYYLVAEGHISKETVETQVMLDKKVIEDKNKSDWIIRSIATVQTLWFVVNCIARAVQKLMITTLELTTCGFIATTLPVVYFWFHKPTDISTSYVLETKATISELRARAGRPASEEWFRTPLSFLDPAESWPSLGWAYFTNILRHLHLGRGRRGRLIESIPDDKFRDMTGFGKVTVQGLFTAVCFAINISAWNLWFPSAAERQLWRISSILVAATIYFGAFYNMVIVPTLTEHRVLERVSSTFTTFLDPWLPQRLRNVRGKFAARLRNNDLQKDPAFTVRLRMIIPGIVFAALYCLARAYLLIEDVISLRSQPPSTYETVNWSDFLPHV